LGHKLFGKYIYRLARSASCLSTFHGAVKSSVFGFWTLNHSVERLDVLDNPTATGWKSISSGLKEG
jgi:hypothetical protein